MLLTAMVVNPLGGSPLCHSTAPNHCHIKTFVKDGGDELEADHPQGNLCLSCHRINTKNFH